LLKNSDEKAKSHFQTSQAWTHNIV
jgi:hypothetical protein